MGGRRAKPSRTDAHCYRIGVWRFSQCRRLQFSFIGLPSVGDPSGMKISDSNALRASRNVVSVISNLARTALMLKGLIFFSLWADKPWRQSHSTSIRGFPAHLVVASTSPGGVFLPPRCSESRAHECNRLQSPAPLEAVVTPLAGVPVWRPGGRSKRGSG